MPASRFVYEIADDPEVTAGWQKVDHGKWLTTFGQPIVVSADGVPRDDLTTLPVDDGDNQES